MAESQVIVCQPVVPDYRLSFFDRVAEKLGDRFSVHASAFDLGVLTGNRHLRSWERMLGPVRSIAPGLSWQTGALSIPIVRNDVVVISGAPRCLSNIALLIKAKWKGAKTIWWGHYWSSTSRPWRVGLRMPLMRLADAVLFYTDLEVEEYWASGGDRSKPVRGLNNGIETNGIAALRSDYDPLARSRDLLFIGRLTAKAELNLLLDALAFSTCANVTLDVIGGGKEEEELRRRCNELKIADRVTWHGATINEKRIAHIANTCKAFVYPGGVGLSLIHGLTYGLPAIVHDNRRKHMPEIAALRAGENGAIFRQGNAASLAAVISSILGDMERLVRMSSAALETTERTFNIIDMAERFQEAIVTVSLNSSVK